MSAPADDPTRRLGPIVRLAPAKLNLSLAVVARRADGFHELHSVMVPLGLADRLSLAPAAGSEDTLHVEGFDPGPPADNLVLRSIAATRAAVGSGWAGSGSPLALAARLEKRIPVAAGLAGGSSDAAAALDGALEAWGADLTIHDRLRIASRLGSDVPFFLAGGAALVEGRGETVTPLRGILGDAPGVLLVTPRVSLVTAEVFAVHDRGPRAGGASRTSSLHLADELRSGLTGRALIDRAGILAVANDLVAAAAAIEPGLVDLRRALSRRLGRPVGQSGSGPTLWVLYPSEAAAAVAADELRLAARAGEIPVPGGGEPFVVATVLASGVPDQPVVTASADRSEP